MFHPPRFSRWEKTSFRGLCGLLLASAIVGVASFVSPEGSAQPPRVRRPPRANDQIAVSEAETFLPRPTPLVTPINEEVLSVAFSPDGKQLAMAGAHFGQPGQFKLWNVASGSETAVARRITAVRSVAFSPDGRNIACGDFAGIISLRDVRYAQYPRTIVNAHTVGVNGLAFSHDGKWLASAGLDRLVKLWEVRDYQETYFGFQGNIENLPHMEFTGPDAAKCVKYEQDGLRIALPAGQEGARPGVGLLTSVPLTGDFEIATTFNINQEPAQADAGGETGLSLAIVLDTPDTPTTITLSRGMTSKGAQFTTTMTVKDKVEAFRDTFPARAKNGRLRLTRTGAGLSFFVADGVNNAYKQLHGIDASTERVKEIRLLGSTGGPKAALEVHFTDLHLRADAISGFPGLATSTELRERKTFSGHGQYVFSVAFFPDGQSIVSGSLDGTAKIWDVASGKEKFTLKGHAEAVEMVAVSADGKTVATGSWDGSIKLWKAEDGSEIATLGSGRGLASKVRDLFGLQPEPAPHVQVLAVAFSPVDNDLLAGACSDGTVRLWDAKTRKLIALLSVQPPSTQAASALGLLSAAPGPHLASAALVAGTVPLHEGSVWGLAFSRDGKYLASGSSDKTAKIWDVAAAKEAGIAKLTANLPAAARPSYPVKALAYAPDGRYLALATDDKTIQIRDATTGDKFLDLLGHADLVTSLAFSADGQTLVSGSLDKTVKIWNWPSGQALQTLKGHGGAVNAVAFSPDGRSVASAGADKSVILWDATRGREITRFNGHTASVQALAFSPDGMSLSSGGADRSIKVWSIADPAAAPVTLAGHQGNVRALAYGAPGLLASAGDDGAVRLWAQGKERFTMKQHAGEVHALAFSPSGRTLVSAGEDATIVVWDPATGESRQVLHGHTDEINALAFDPQGNQLLSGGLDATWRWRGADGSFPLRTLPGAVGDHRFAVFSPGGDRLASGGDSGKVSIWTRSLLPARYPRTTAFEPGNYSDVAFSPDGRTLALASRNTVQLCDPLSGQVLQTLPLKWWTRLLAYSPDGKYLAVGLGNVKAQGGGAEIMLFDTANWQGLARFDIADEYPFSMQFSPDGKTLATSERDKTIHLWDIPSGMQRGILTGHTSNARELAFLPDGTLVSASWDGTIRFWNVSEQKQIKSWPVRLQSASLAVSPDGTLLAAADGPEDGMPCTLKVWEVATAKLKLNMPGISNRIMHLAFTRDGRGLIGVGGRQAVGGRQNGFGEIRYWNLTTGGSSQSGNGSNRLERVAVSRDGHRVLAVSPKGLHFNDLELMIRERTWVAHEQPVICGLFLQDGKTLATGGAEGVIKLWDVASKKAPQVLAGHEGAVRALAVLPDGATLVSGGDDKTAKLWDLATFKEKSTLHGHTLPIASLAVSHDGKTLATGGGEVDKPGAGELILWDLETGQQIKKIADIDKAVCAVAYAGDGNWLAAGIAPNLIRIWDAKSGDEKARFTAPNIRALAFSPDAKHLAAGQGRIAAEDAGDGSVTLFDLTAWRPRADLQKHRGAINTVVFSPDGWTVASASQDTTIKITSIAPVRTVSLNAEAKPDKVAIGDMGSQPTRVVAPPQPVVVAPNKVAQDTSSASKQSASPPPPVKKTDIKPWIPIAEAIALVLTLSMVVGLAVFLRVRQRPVVADEPVIDTPLEESEADEPVIDTPLEDEPPPPITFACPGCKHNYRARPEFAGKKVKCKKCGHAIRVPQA